MTDAPPDDAAGPRGWTLSVTGAVRQSKTFTREALLSETDATTSDGFACVDARRSSDARYSGVRVASLLDRVRPESDARFALVHAEDGRYTAAFRRDRLSAYVLAVRADGEPLPVEDGGPARLLPTDDAGDCWQHVKWVEEIELRTDDPSDEATARALTVDARP